MKKILAIILISLTLLTLLTGCTEIQKDESKLQIVTVNFPPYDFARQLAGEKAQVSMLIPPGSETHSFEPTTSDILEVSQCDIFIYTGGESDKWIDSILKSADNPQMTVIKMMDCVESLCHDEHNHDHSENTHHSHIDEHVWTSPLNAVKICDSITKALCEKDKENSEYYKRNFNSYEEELLALDESFRDVISTAERNTFVFGDRFPLLYFAKEYGLEYHAAFSGCSEDTEPSASTVAKLIDIVNEEKIPVVYKIELSSDSIAKTICKETDAQMITFYSCHNISKADFENCETYLSLMQKNAESLKIALN